MTATGTKHLFSQVVKVTHYYLGPAAERFVARQIESHLGKQPENLSRKDLQELIHWIQVGMSMLVDDSRLIERYIAELKSLA